MHLVHGPEIDLLIGGQSVEFFYAPPVSEGLHARLAGEACGRRVGDSGGVTRQLSSIVVDENRDTNLGIRPPILR